MAETLRLGLIVPSGGPEADYYGYEEASAGAIKFYMTISQVGGTSGQDHEIDALHQTAQIDWLLEAIERLRRCRLDSIQWACTSGSFIRGRAYAEQQVQALEQAMGVPASSTSLAFVRAIAHLGLQRVAVLATYPEQVARHFTGFLGEFGVDVAALQWLDAPSGWDASRMGEELITSKAATLAAPGIDAILIPDTALPSLHYLERLESRLGLPVLTANAVTVWDAQRIAGRVSQVPDYGTLLSQRPEAGIA